MVTHEERHTTRGRAHHLWEMLNGNVIENGWRDESVKEALDLCLACKGCKGDCPVNVDMATYKAEFLSHYWEGRVRPRYAYAFGLDRSVVAAGVGRSGICQSVHPASGACARSPRSWLACPRSGRFRLRAADIQSHGSASAARATRAGRKVTLWADTFNNYFFPETAQAAVEVLEHFGYQVQVPHAASLLRASAVRLRLSRTRAQALPADQCWTRWPTTSRPARRWSCWNRVAARSSATN